MTRGAYQLSPWTHVARPHPDVTGGALEMGIYAVNLAKVFREDPFAPEVYLRPERFFASTYFTEALKRLLSDVLGVLAGEPGGRVIQLRTPFGGGKTHSLVSLLHLARHREAARAVPELAGLPDPGPVEVAVLSGEELDPLRPIRSSGGQQTHTLWGELAAQLGRYELVAKHDRIGAAPGGHTLREVLGDGPVLLLLDEVLVYVEKAMAVERGNSTLGRQAMLFVQALTEAVNSHPRAAMVYSLQASAGEAVGAEGLLAQLDHLVSRIDIKREPVSGDEVMRVIQRRLFSDLGDPAAHRQVAAAYADLVRRQLVAQAETPEARREADAEARRLEDRIVASYPFHPELLDLMYHRWGTLPSYQRTRGALQFLACATHALWHAGSAGALIGPGDVDLSDEATRGAFFSQVGERERYTSVLDGDIVAEGSGAKVVDRRIGADAPALAQLRVGTRAATAVMLFSFGAREGEERGVLESDLVASALVPGLDRNVVLAALHDLREEELYLHYTGRRYRFEPTPNLTKLVRDEANKFSGPEVLEVVRRGLEAQLRGNADVVVWPSGPEGVRDKIPRFILVYLHPDWSGDAQPLTRFIEEASGGKRTFKNGLGLVLPDTSQFDRARAAARLRRATGSLLGRKAEHGFSPEQEAELKEKLAAAQRDLDATLARAYEKVVVAVKAGEAGGPFFLEEVDLRSLLAAGRSLHDRVVEALSHRVFDRLTIDKFISLAGLGPDRPFVIVGELVEWFYSYFDFTKLASQAAIADAISRGVAERRFAFATGVTVYEGRIHVRDPRLIRSREMLPTSEIDLGDESALLMPELAASLAPATEPPTPGGAGPEPGPDRGEPPAPRQPPPGEIVRNVAIRARLDGAGLFGLNRALSWLREQSRGLDIEVTVRASAHDAGYDRVRLRNGVIEPLEEGGADPQVELS